MSRRKYETLAPEMEEYADRVADDFENHGYSVRVEKRELGFPYTPTLLAKREHTTIVIDVCSSISLSRLDNWVSFGRSCGHDLQVVVCVSDSVSLSTKDHDNIRSRNCGLVTVGNTDVIHLITSRDLGLNIPLPNRSSLSPRLRALLGTAYDRFDNGLWREGFDEACRVFEVAARQHLKRWIKTGRIQLVTKKGPKKITGAKVEKLTIGQLAETFGQIQAKTRTDSQVEQTLAAINKDRVSLVHHKHKKWTENRLRKNVGRHMWAIVDALRLLV
jgi:hypothetical protein